MPSTNFSWSRITVQSLLLRPTAVCGTELAYGGTELVYGGTELAYGAGGRSRPRASLSRSTARSRPLPSYQRPTRSPVLT
eukprot:2239729-Rhodomonas_salina.1